MKTLTTTQVRNNIFNIIKNGENIEIKHPVRSMVIVDKAEYEKMFKALVNQEMDDALEKAKGEKRYSTEEVDLMLAKVLGEDNG